mmetsp:Transcript_32738/g.92860  ORF Transcript_32738/g.92860 Transcript_32738/m.92860 type:complete len:80 (+) Transcript_32738:94-333(+)
MLPRRLRGADQLQAAAAEEGPRQPGWRGGRWCQHVQTRLALHTVPPHALPAPALLSTENAALGQIVETNTTHELVGAKS